MNILYQVPGRRRRFPFSPLRSNEGKNEARMRLQHSTPSSLPSNVKLGRHRTFNVVCSSLSAWFSFDPAGYSWLSTNVLVSVACSSSRSGGRSSRSIVSLAAHGCRRGSINTHEQMARMVTGLKIRSTGTIRWTIILATAVGVALSRVSAVYKCQRTSSPG